MAFDRDELKRRIGIKGIGKSPGGFQAVTSGAIPEGKDPETGLPYLSGVAAISGKNIRNSENPYFMDTPYFLTDSARHDIEQDAIATMNKPGPVSNKDEVNDAVKARQDALTPEQVNEVFKYVQFKKQPFINNDSILIDGENDDTKTEEPFFAPGTYNLFNKYLTRTGRTNDADDAEYKILDADEKQVGKEPETNMRLSGDAKQSQEQEQAPPKNNWYGKMIVSNIGKSGANIAKSVGDLIGAATGGIGRALGNVNLDSGGDSRFGTSGGVAASGVLKGLGGAAGMYGDYFGKLLGTIGSQTPVIDTIKTKAQHEQLQDLQASLVSRLRNYQAWARKNGIDINKPGFLHVLANLANTQGLYNVTATRQGLYNVTATRHR